MAGLEEQLGLDVSPALSAIEEIDKALQAAVTGFADALATALGDLTGIQVPVDANTAPMEEGIAAAEAAIPDAEVPVNADTTQAEAAIQAVEGSAPEVDIPVVADTSEAQASIDDLGASASDAATGGGGGGGGFEGLSGAVLGFEAAASGAEGSAAGLSAGLSSMGGSTKEAVAGLGAFTAFVGVAVSAAADAEAQNKRFTATFGDMSEAVQHIDVGGLVIDMKDLAAQSGTTEANMQATATRIGQLGQSAGASQTQIKETTDNLLALGSTIAVNNPRLGDAAAVTDRMTNAFARGGRALAPFGIALSSAQINAEALRETGKQSAADLTLFEKATAGAQLALQKYGDTLGTTFASGAQNAEIQLRAMKTQLEETLVTVGKPLLQPTIDTLKNMVPVAEAVGIALGKLAAAILPLIADLSPALIPLATAIGFVGDGITALEQAASSLSPGMLIAIAGGLALLGASALEASVGIAAIGITLGAVINPITIVIGALAALGVGFALFHQKTADTKDDTEQINKLSESLLNLGDSAAAVSGQILSVGPDIAKQMQALFSVEAGGATAQQAIDRLGLSYADLTKLLLGNQDAFDKFTLGLLEQKGLSDDQMMANDDLASSLEKLHTQMDDVSRAALDSAVSDKILTQAQEDNALTVTGSWTAAYLKLKPTIDAATAAQDKATLGSKTHAQAIAELDAKYAEGKITADQYNQGLTDIGVSTEGAKKATDDYTKAVDAWGKTISGTLPTAASALQAYNQGVSQSMSQLDSDTKHHTGNIQDDLHALAANQDVNVFTGNLLKQEAAIADFWKNVEKLMREGNDALAALLIQQGPEQAGALAQGYASDASKAKIANGVAQQTQTIEQQYQAWAQAQYPVLFAHGEQGGATYVGGIGAGAAGAAPAVAQGGKQAVDGAQDQIKGHAATKGQETGASYAGGIGAGTGAGISATGGNLVGEAVTGFWPSDSIASKVFVYGQAVGGAFLTGVAFGIETNQGGSQDSLNNAVADAFAKAVAPLHHSPELTIGIETGQAFMAGVAKGIADSRVLGAVVKTAVTESTAGMGAGTVVNVNVTGTVSPADADVIGERVGAGVVRQLVRRNVVQAVRANA